jgi:ubiquinone/menaquinone biosynthesis C-methylase UbiE
VSLSVAAIARQSAGVLEPENDNEARLNRLQPPERVMDAVGITTGLVLAEIGAGRGRYTVHLAVRVGETGKVYAEDIDAAALRHLDRRCQTWKLKNVESIRGDVLDAKLPDGELDLIFIISSYHHFEDPVTLLQGALKALKPDGKLAIVEWLPWSKSDTEGTEPEVMESQMRRAGYLLVRTENLAEDKPLNVYIFKPDAMLIPIDP